MLGTNYDPCGLNRMIQTKNSHAHQHDYEDCAENKRPINEVPIQNSTLDLQAIEWLEANAAEAQRFSLKSEN
jgi:hypothetical protein